MSSSPRRFSRRRMLGVAGFTGLAAAGGLVRPGIVWATAGPARVKSMVD